jgi:hypothetical protein
MSQVGNAANPDGNYRWRVHVHVPDATQAVSLIRSLGHPSELTVSELVVARDPEPAPASSYGHER